MSVTFTITGQQEIVARFSAIDSNETKTRVFASVAKELVKNSKKRVQAETDLNNAAWTRRKNGRRRKMLVKLGRSIKVLIANETGAIVGFTSPFAGQLAGKHQYGSTEPMTKAKLVAEEQRSRFSVANKTDPATKRQIAKLLAYGYKIKIKGKGYKTPTKKWIKEHITVAQAAGILRALGAEREVWEVALPARSFLGVSDADLPALNAIAAQQMKSSLGI